MSNFHSFFAALISFCFSCNSFADPFTNAACKYSIDKGLLIAIAINESHLNNGAINKNSDGTRDYCMMQINTFWLPKMVDISSEDLLKDPYVCVEAGAWVLAQNFKSHGRTWLAVGGYNAGFAKNKKSARARYIQAIQTNYQQVMQGRYEKKLATLGWSTTLDSCE